MDLHNQQPEPQSTLSQVVTQISQEKEHRSSISKIVLILFSFVILLGLIGGAYYMGLKKGSEVSSKNMLANPPHISPTGMTESSVPPISANPLADWKTYTDKQYGFSVKYPGFWQLQQPQVNDQTQYTTTIPSFMAKSYDVNFSIPNTNNPKDGSLFAGIAVYANPLHWSTANWVTQVEKNAGLDPNPANDPVRNQITVAGVRGIQTRINPGFSDIFMQNQQGDTMFVLSYYGNGEGGPTYADSDVFVMQNSENFKLFLSSFTFTQ